MVTSNEPGFYADGRFGIRIESLVICNEEGTPHRFGDVKYVLEAYMLYVYIIDIIPPPKSILKGV